MTDQNGFRPEDFVHLHVHSEYSLTDASIRTKDLIQTVKAQNGKAVALTDHANMFGAIEFYNNAKASDVNPIIGCEIYFCGTERTTTLAQELDHKLPKTGAFHLVLLAKNLEGYKNLIKIVSLAFVNKSEDVPIVSWDVLKNHTKGLFALSSCALGELGYLVEQLRHNHPTAELFQDPRCLKDPCQAAISTYFNQMQDAFGSDSFYIELIDNNLERQHRLIPDLIACANAYKIPLVATADAHYLKPEDKDPHTILVSIKNELKRSSIRDRNRDVLFHLRSPEEMFELFKHCPQALENTKKIADQCHLELVFNQYILPQFTQGTEETANDALIRLSKEGLEQRLAQLAPLYGDQLDGQKRKEYSKRLDFEIDIIIKMGFPGYFLIVQDFINWAKEHSIPVGPGRGSGAGSLVAYSLRITDLDPLRYNLVFERFLNPERVSMPDFDVDFCQWRRDEVIQYVAKRYGSDQVAQITTFGKMQAKAAIRDVGRALDMRHGDIDRIAKLVPNELGITLKDALSKEPKFKEESERDERVAELLSLAQKVEGLCRHTSVHAAGVVISDGPLINHAPIYKTEDGGLVTQYEMKNAEKVGLIKFDFLGLKTLTVIEKAVMFIRKTNPDFKIETIPMEDEKVFSMVSAAHTVGVFQLESQGMQQLLVKLKPSCFEDIIAVVALFRPGPLGSGMVDDFIERKHGRQKIIYPLPALEPILKETYGIILYQEQVQKIAASLASYSLGEADLLRRAMGKKKPEEMAQQQTRFIKGCSANNVEESTSRELFDLMAKFAEYGFNKSHSAAYGLISYQTAYLKAHFPEQFMAAIMTCDTDNTDKIVRYVEECKRLKIHVRPPHVNYSIHEFSIPKGDRRTINFSLNAIKGIGGPSIERLIDERKKAGAFKNLTDICKRLDLSKVGKKTLELLTEAGAFDGFGYTRKNLIKQFPDMLKVSLDIHNAKSTGQQGLFDNIEEADTCDEQTQTFPWELNELDENVKVSAEDLFSERKLLGVFLSGHPIHMFSEDVQYFGSHTVKALIDLIATPSTSKKREKTQVKIVAILSDVQLRMTKSGQRIAYVKIEDQLASFEAVMFEKDMPEDWPPKDSPVLILGIVEQQYDGQKRFNITSIKTLESIRLEKIKRINIQLRPPINWTTKSKTESKLRLKKILEASNGTNHGTKLSLNIDLKNTRVVLSLAQQRIIPSDSFLQSISNLPHLQASVKYQI